MKLRGGRYSCFCTFFPCLLLSYRYPFICAQGRAGTSTLPQRSCVVNGAVLLGRPAMSVGPSHKASTVLDFSQLQLGFARSLDTDANKHPTHATSIAAPSGPIRPSLPLHRP